VSETKHTEGCKCSYCDPLCRKPLYSSLQIVLKPGVQTVVVIEFDPPLEKAPKVTFSAESDNGFFELKELKTKGRVHLR
jgi:hypothetical protein